MEWLSDDTLTFGQHDAVVDEFAEIDDVFWSVVSTLPPDSPFLRHLAALFQSTENDSTKTADYVGNRTRSRVTSPSSTMDDEDFYNVQAPR